MKEHGQKRDFSLVHPKSQIRHDNQSLQKYSVQYRSVCVHVRQKADQYSSVSTWMTVCTLGGQIIIAINLYFKLA